MDGSSVGGESEEKVQNASQVPACSRQVDSGIVGPGERGAGFTAVAVERGRQLMLGSLSLRRQWTIRVEILNGHLEMQSL